MSDRPRSDESTEADPLAQGLLDQIELLWEVELGDTGMAVDFDPVPER
jgi:hypothetical protein